MKSGKTQRANLTSAKLLTFLEGQVCKPDASSEYVMLSKYFIPCLFPPKKGVN